MIRSLLTECVERWTLDGFHAISIHQHFIDWIKLICRESGKPSIHRLKIKRPSERILVILPAFSMHFRRRRRWTYSLHLNAKKSFSFVMNLVFCVESTIHISKHSTSGSSVWQSNLDVSARLDISNCNCISHIPMKHNNDTLHEHTQHPRNVFSTYSMSSFRNEMLAHT